MSQLRQDAAATFPVAALTPSGAVIDEKRGVQHAFSFLAAHPNGPAGVFRITGTLDTRRFKETLSGTSRK